MRKKKSQLPKFNVTWEGSTPVPSIGGDYSELWVTNNSNQQARVQYGDNVVDVQPYSVKCMDLKC